MKYLITGGAGFIGSHLADYLIERGHKVHVLDNLSTGSRENIDRLAQNDQYEYTIGSILDYQTTEKLVAECDQIFHLAAAVGVKWIMERPVETIETNVHGTENMLRLASYFGKKILVASTSEVYGKSMETSGKNMLSEADDWTLGTTTKRRWAYACSKALDEFLSLAYYDERQLPVVVARFFNTVGPRQRGRYGMVIPNFVQAALQNRPITVFGDGKQTRCFTYVSDAVGAVARLMDEPEAEGKVLNIGGGEEISMNELAKRVVELTGSTSVIEHVTYEEAYGRGYEDMRRRTPDISKLQSIISYEPNVSIDLIIREVAAYYRGIGVVA